MYTPMQQKAIDTRNKSLLVSAGAGSGKTTVLTQRLIERIKSGDSVTDFLVVTFMKAAASDIKRKLYDELLKASAAEPDNKHLYRQLHLISEANICTISSYCLSLVKENFSLLGISPKVRVMDETESAMLLRRVADELIAKGYQEENASFLLLADNFSGDKNDEPLADSMIRLYNTLRVTLERKKMLLNCADGLRNDAEITEKSGFFATGSGKEMQNRLKDIYKGLLSRATEMYEYAATVATDDKYLEPINRFLNVIEDTYASIDESYVNYSRCAEASVKTITLARSGCNAEDRAVIGEIKKEIVKQLKSCYQRYCRGSEGLISESFLKCADIVLAVNSFLDSLDREYEQAKLESGTLDYTDFEQKALQLLETTDCSGDAVPTELCLKKQKSFKEILIDEYQDVNPMQDRLFRLLAGKSHRFMVGDVKQSIYRFRNAYPDIFLAYKAEYPDIASASDSDTAKIFLRENFRCSQTVINYVNYIFDVITSGTSYRSEYDGEWLIHASARPERFHPVVVAVADKKKDEAKEARRNEAEFIAREILRLVNEETADDGSPLKFSDFAVMLGAMKGYSIEYEKAFNKFGIPYKTETAENFLENPDIRLALSALKAIDDPTDDISLCALMRSPICNFTSNDLYRIRLNLTAVPFWSAVSVTARPKPKRLNKSVFSFKKSFGDKSLCTRCREFIFKMNSWRNESAGVPGREFLKSFFVSSGLLRIATASGSRSSLLLLFEYSNRYETSQNHGISGFLDYIAELSVSGKEISDAARTGEEDAVSFITVHKSKGLEFKVCFLAGTEKRFLGMKNTSDITVLRTPEKKGIYFRLRDRTRLTTYDPLCNVLASDAERESILGEEFRKLYVALTRAKERLYITGCADEGWQDMLFSPADAQSWLELVLSARNKEKAFFDVRPINEASGSSGWRPKAQKRLVTPTDEMLSAVLFEYPYSKVVRTAAKISVSELREGLLEDDEYDRTHLSVPLSRVSLRPAFVSEDISDAGEIGTANHLFMQFCDFSVAEKNVRAEAQRLLSKRMITEKQLKMLDFDSLHRFFKGELHERIKASKRVYREKRFSVNDIIEENGEPILVQGVIDCFFENPDGSFTVVDYKTDRVKTYKELADRHRVQLTCYIRAVERMTERRVSEALLYSFALGGTVDVK